MDQAFLRAVKGGDLPLIEAYLRGGGEVDAVDAGGFTALMWAAEKNQQGGIETIVASGATIDKADRRGRTALFWAASNGRLEALQSLLDLGAEPRWLDKYGNTLLITAVDYDPTSRRPRRTDTSIVRHVLGLDLSANASNKAGITPLILAAEWGRQQVAKVLLEAGADINKSDKSGSTALHTAAGSAFAKVGFLRLLMKHGADINARDRKKRSVLSRTTCNKYEPDDIQRLFAKKREYLLEKGAA